MYAMETCYLEPKYHDRKSISDNFVMHLTLKSATVSICNNFGLPLPYLNCFELTFHQQTKLAFLRILIHILYLLTIILSLVDAANLRTF